jgi:hypothetical protein
MFLFELFTVFTKRERHYLMPWKTLMMHLNNVPSLRPACLKLLLADVDPQLKMHTKSMRRLWKFAMDLVTVNMF